MGGGGGGCILNGIIVNMSIISMETGLGFGMVNASKK